MRAAATSCQSAAVCCVYEIKAGPAGELYHHPQLDPVVRRVNQVLLRPEVSFGGLHRSVPEQQLDLLQFTARRAAQLRAGATTVVGAIPGTPAANAYGWSNCQTTFSLRPTPCALPARFTGRKTYPSATAAADVHASIATLTQVGIGIVRTRPCFPTRSTMHHRPSRCWT